MYLKTSIDIIYVIDITFISAFYSKISIFREAGRFYTDLLLTQFAKVFEREDIRM